MQALASRWYAVLSVATVMNGGCLLVDLLVGGVWV
jgi:hypothetical protein